VQKGRGGEDVLDLSIRLDFLAAAREPMCRQWRWHVEKTRRHCSNVQKPSLALFLQIPEGFGFFRIYFVIFLIVFDLF
jgi:hypothetical protein